MIHLPEKCPRGLSTCQPLANLVDDEKNGFICCGLNDVSDRVHEQDEFAHCWKNEHVDYRDHWDNRDIIDTVSVLMRALSIKANIDYNAKEKI